MENLHESGKIYFFKTSNSEKPSEAFGPLLEVNSNFDILKSLSICGSKALGITSNNELLEWEIETKQKSRVSSPSKNAQTQNSSNKTKNNKKKDFNFLLFKPSYHFHKIKFIQITLNKTMCLGMDIYHNVLVWGQNKEGLLGLGYEITSVDTPTLISKLKEIKEIALSEYHAVALNNNGNAFSWGLGKYGELGLERSIYTPTPQQILTETVYSHVFCGNLITCFIDENGKFFYFGVVIKQLGGYGNIVTIKSLLNDQSYQDGKNIYFEKEIEELENESFKNIVIGNGFVALLSKNGLLYVLEYNNKLTMLYNKYFLYNITVAYNEIYGLARERPKIDKNKKDNYYLFKWNSKFSSENDLYSDIWNTTIWKFKSDFQLISNCKLLETNNNKNILLLKDEDENYNLTNSIFNPHRKNLEMSTQNNDLALLEKSVNNPNISAFGDLVINKKIIPEKFLEYINQYDDSYNIKYKKCKLKLNIRTGLDNSSSYLNNNKSRTVAQYLKYSHNNNINGNNKNSSSLSPFMEQNISHNNNLFNESYNAQLDLGKDNDNVNIYKPEDDDDIMNEKEKELNKYKNEVDNIINNFKTKKDNQKSIYSSQNDMKRNKKNESSLKYISQNNSNQNERYSNNDQNYFNGQDEQNFVERNKFKLSKEEIMNLMKLEKKKKEYMNSNSNYNDSLSRVRNNIISMKDKIKFKDKALNKINNLFTLGEEEEDEEDESFNKNNIENSDDNNINSNKNNNNNKTNKSKKTRNKFKNNKFMRSPSFSIIKSRNKNNKNNNEDNNQNSQDDFINIENLDTFKRKRYNSKDSIFLKDKNNEFESNKFNNNLGDKYISGNNSDNENSNINESKNKTIKIKNKFKGKRIYQKNGKGEYEDNEEEEEDDDNNNINNRNQNKKKKKITNEQRKHIGENEKKVKKNKNLKKRKIRNKNGKNNEEEEFEYFEEEEEEEEDDEDEAIDFFDEVNDSDKKIRKIKNIKEKKKIRVKKNNSLANIDFIEFNKPKGLQLLEDSFKEINIKSRNNKKSNSLDKIDKRKSISNILNPSNIIFTNKKKKQKKKYNNKGKIKEYENDEEEEQSNENEINKINKNKKNPKTKNKKGNNNQNQTDKKENSISNYNDDKNEYNENNEITFNKNRSKNKNNNIDNKKQFNQGKKNLNKNNNNKTEDEESKNSYKEQTSDYISESGTGNNNQKSRINKLKNNMKTKKKIEENKKESNFKDRNNNKKNKMKNFKIYSNAIAINKFSLMYFCDLIEHYMKKKSFALCARQIANYQKYLEIKFSLKILFRVILKRIIFYKLKFMHRYKRINKYLIKNRIKNIKYAYKKKK